MCVLWRKFCENANYFSSIRPMPMPMLAWRQATKRRIYFLLMYPPRTTGVAISKSAAAAFFVFIYTTLPVTTDPRFSQCDPGQKRLNDRRAPRPITQDTLGAPQDPSNERMTKDLENDILSQKKTELVVRRHTTAQRNTTD